MRAASFHSPNLHDDKLYAGRDRGGVATPSRVTGFASEGGPWGSSQPRAALVYLVGFSLAHFWKGFTGLTVTVLAIVTLFVVMQLTSRMRWSEVLQPSTRATALKS